jgi:hypothetical protein
MKLTLSLSLLLSCGVMMGQDQTAPKRVETLTPTRTSQGSERVSVPAMERSMRQMMDYLASASGVNIVAANEALDIELRKEMVCVRQLDNVKWRMLLELLCKDKGLRLDDQRLKENILIIWRPKLVNLQVKDAELRDVVWSIAQQANLNVIIDPEVRGTVTASMKNVAWDEALQAVLKTNGYIAIRERESLRIAR